MTSQLECSIFRLTLECFIAFFLLIKCSHGASFKNEKDKWQTIRKHQYIMWQRQVWDLEFWRIFQNILKYFSKFWNTIRWPFCKTGKIFRCFQLILLPFKNTHYVIVPIRTVVQKTQFHFVVNMHKNHFYKTKQNFVTIFCLIYKEIIWTWWWVGWGLLCKSRWKCQKVQLPLGLLKFLLKC